MKTRRQARYVFIRKMGLLPFEARPLSRVPPNVPYFKEMLRERRAMFKKAAQMKVTQAKWEEQIKELYKVNRWQKLGRTGKIVADPWQMLRQQEEKWRDKQPQYESPWEGRQRTWRDFLPKVEKTLQRQLRRG
jgi:hypothetical protein